MSVVDLIWCAGDSRLQPSVTVSISEAIWLSRPGVDTIMVALFPGQCRWWMMAPTLMTKVTLEERGSVIMRSQQLVHNIANDGAFNPLRAGTGMEKTSRHLSYLPLSPHFVSLTISVLGTVSRDISSHNTVNDEIWKICLNGFTPRSLLLSRSSLCEPWGLSLITPDAEVLRLSWH